MQNQRLHLTNKFNQNLKPRILITGGFGFIGSNLIRYFLKKHKDYDIINFDLPTYAGNPYNLNPIKDNAHYHYIKGDITSNLDVESIMKDIDYVIHLAAESHVDRSIQGPEIFIKTNVLGTQILLESAKKNNIQRFIHISTDEVYGSLGKTGLFTEETPITPNSPYSASKAGSDLLVYAYYKTFNFPSIITRCSNNYGPYQFPEKLIPLIISNALENIPLPVYGDGMNVRDWIHVEDHCSAIDAVLHRGRVGEFYNIGGNNEWHNIDIIKLILMVLCRSESLINFVKDRPGHDRRYAIDASKIKNELGWQPKIQFEDGIKRTIEWYKNNTEWLRRIKSGEYRI